jgi:hypothetical protein
MHGSCSSRVACMGRHSRTRRATFNQLLQGLKGWVTCRFQRGSRTTAPPQPRGARTRRARPLLHHLPRRRHRPSLQRHSHRDPRRPTRASPGRRLCQPRRGGAIYAIIISKLKKSFFIFETSKFVKPVSLCHCLGSATSKVCEGCNQACRCA